MRALVIVYPNYSKLLIIGYLPTQNLLSDAESNICKYKYLNISILCKIWGQILRRGTLEGRKIVKNLPMKLPPTKEKANI